MVESLTGAPPQPAQRARSDRQDAIEDLELNLLLEAVVRSSGHDFRDYAQGTLKRRIAERMRGEEVATISGLQERLLHDPQALARFVLAMSGSAAGLFRDPAFFQVLRTSVVPLLRTYTFARIWVPNCISGEEAYSIATLLHEEGVLPRSMIYATDESALAIEAAKTGIFTVESREGIESAHRATGADGTISDVCRIEGHTARFDETLRKHIIFAQHSLVTDGSLNEFHCIVARGTLPQFNKALQYRVHNLFLNSLTRLGFLCLGRNETLKYSPHERVFRPMAEGEAIYRRMR